MGKKVEQKQKTTLETFWGPAQSKKRPALAAVDETNKPKRQRTTDAPPKPAAARAAGAQPDRAVAATRAQEERVPFPR